MWDVQLDFVRQFKSKKLCSTTLKSWDVRLGISLMWSSNCQTKSKMSWTKSKWIVKQRIVEHPNVPLIVWSNKLFIKYLTIIINFKIIFFFQDIILRNILTFRTTKMCSVICVEEFSNCTAFQFEDGNCSIGKPDYLFQVLKTIKFSSEVSITKKSRSSLAIYTRD